MDITTDKNGRSYLKVNATRVGITIVAGPWVAGVPSEMIKLRARKSRFPEAFREVLAVENNSDMITDYFEADCIRIMPGHPLYLAAQSQA